MRRRSRGSALLLALLVVAVVATFSAQAYWQQHRAWAAEQAEQHRLQSRWLLAGALDWARQLLREDARASAIDHLGEAWALPLADTPVTAFLSADGRSDDPGLPEALLAGRITDLQGRMNLRNLLRGEEDRPVRSDEDLAAFRRLFAALHLPDTELERLVTRLLQAHHGDPEAGSAPTRPLPPQRFGQLAWLGLAPHTLDALAPHATWLPERTPLNLNTAGPLALWASVPGLELAQAQRFVGQRGQAPLQRPVEARPLLGNAELPADRFATGSQYFEVQGRVHWDGHTLHERSLVRRSGLDLHTLWRDRDDPSPDRRRSVTQP
ncbi:type II secretion system minor pseudopilin GspK [Aquabacterium sp. A08]|uniref:type II secretion system minor pseudopilin GspK n=1 Tax=Aquabacterium sp. A08 TaxID=2718532 RepID=UPI001421D11F|nr:type II secretion system minor pseudopilin GspK [Aquabacterium sp. A08]NIC42234.1 type II secretion system minor pseudopilin GspK [Aquabacterium sp. A08]